MTSMAGYLRHSFTAIGPPRLLMTTLCALLPLTQAQAQYVDTNASCLICHQQALPQNDFCSIVPAATWAQDDKHNRAFFLLHETDPADPQKGAAKRELVRQILGFDLREVFVDDRYVRLKDDADAEKVATVKSCLRCHATWPKEAEQADGRFKSAPPVPLALGVSCQACHGPGEKWETPHRLAAWRMVTPEAKAALGCTSVRSPADKARLCASCHVGDVAQDRFVRHEWYAAGHPPLPGFELSSFATQMPAHWKSLKEKGAFALRDQRFRDDSGAIAGQIAALERAGIPSDAIKLSYREANFPTAQAAGFDPFSDLPRTKEAIVAGVVMLESYTRLLGDYSALAAENKAPWPELALYDCSACHHELRSGLGLNARPKRRNVPGRPPLATWPTLLARVAAHQAADYEPTAAQGGWKAVDERLMDLERATTTIPFGDAAAMRDASQALAAGLKQLASDAESTRFDDAAARRAVTLLTNPDSIETNDFFTARQTAWALRQFAGDLASPVANTLFRRDSADVLALDLPSGPSRSLIDNLHHWLSAAGNYDPAWFRDELKATRAKLNH